VPQRYTTALKACDVMDSPSAREASDHLPVLSILNAVAPEAPASGSSASDANRVVSEVDETELTP
jgi:hypothetical protein